MARAGITRAQMATLRLPNKQIYYRGLTKSAEAVLDDDDDGQQESFTRNSSRGEKMNNSKETLVNWVPHPRSGIYVPQGHERVMDDVPINAASFGHRTFWLRSDDGVEKPNPDYDYSL
ncbi:hypothetical protein AB3S75_040686 [Citrus x aurantiifolia]